MEIKKLLNDKQGVGGLRRFVIGLFFAIAFSFVLIFFIVGFLNNTNPSSEILNSTYGLNQSMNSLSNTINNFSQTVNETQITLAKSDTSKAGVVLFLIFQGAFDIPRAVLGFLGSGTNALFSLVTGSVGKGSVFSFIIPLVLSILVLTGVFLIVKAIRTGETEY